MNIKELLESHGITPFRAGNKHGGEYHSACPGCGDGSPRRPDQGPPDRFQIWPDKADGYVYTCRRCGKYGDMIQFLVDFDGKTFREACGILGVQKDGAGYVRHQSPRPPVPRRQEFVPHVYDQPAEAWLAKAQEFSLWCHEQLLASAEGQELLARRGLSLETARRYRIGFNPGENGKDLYRARAAWGLPAAKKDNGRDKALWLPRGLVLPLLDGDGRAVQLRIRRRDEDVRAFLSGIKYQLIEGSSHATMVLNRSAKAFMVVESGLDAYLAAQEGQGLIGAVTTWNATAKPDQEATALLGAALRILVSLDSDPAGAKASAWWLETFRQARRWPVPGHKDPGEAAAAGLDIRRWIIAGLPPALTQVDLANLAAKSTVIEGGGGKKQADERCEAQPMEPAGDDVAELGAILGAHPVRVQKNEYGDLRIIWTPEWRTANKGTASRLSELVFKSIAAGNFISRHPHKVIGARNFKACGAAL